MFIRIKGTSKQRLTRVKDGQHTMVKGSIEEDDIAIVNRYASNIRAPLYIRQMLTNLKREIDRIAIIMEL